MSIDEDIYASEDYFERPKDTFRFVSSEVATLPGTRLLDLGCARGEFLHFLHRTIQRPWQALHGVDVSPRLLSLARDRLAPPLFRFTESAVENYIPSEGYDIVTSCGLLGYINDLNIFFDLLRRCLVPDGHALLFGLMNTEEIDVRSEFCYLGLRERANLHAIRTLSEHAANHGLMTLKTHTFEPNFSVARQPDNRRRAWTIDTPDGVYFTNGLGQCFRLHTMLLRRSP